MDRSLHHIVRQRDRGRRRVGTVTTWSALAGTGLATAFTLLFAQTGAAAADSSAERPVSGDGGAIGVPTYPGDSHDPDGVLLTAPNPAANPAPRSTSLPRPSSGRHVRASSPTTEPLAAPTQPPQAAPTRAKRHVSSGSS